jgi:putative transposase
MSRYGRKSKPLPTIWHVPDDLWKQIQPVLDELDPPAHTGRPRIDARAALDGIIYQMRTGCQWNVLPMEFGDDSSVHRTFLRWIKKGVLERIWATLIESCEELGGVEFRWQAADTAMGKARMGGIKSAPTRRIERKTAPSMVF